MATYARHGPKPGLTPQSTFVSYPQHLAEMKIQSANHITIFMCGDVMTGRGIDQVLPSPSAPHLFESYMKSAAGYVRLAEQKNGPDGFLSQGTNWKNKTAGRRCGRIYPLGRQVGL